MRPKAKFKVGDVCKVFRRNSGFDEGSELRDNFIIEEVGWFSSVQTYLYMPKGDEYSGRGAYEMQLQLKNQSLKELLE